MDRKMATVPEEAFKHLAKDASLAARASLAITAAAIPVIGGPISAGIGLWETERLTQRFETLVDHVAEQVARIDDSKLDRTYVNTDGFQDAILVAFDAARRTSDSEKLRWIAAALVGSATTDRPQQLDVESVLRGLSGLSPAELQIARAIHAESGRGGLFPRSASAPNVPDADFHLKHIEAAGLVRSEPSPNIIGPSHTTYRPTPTFDRIMELLHAGGLVF